MSMVIYIKVRAIVKLSGHGFGLAILLLTM